MRISSVCHQMVDVCQRFPGLRLMRPSCRFESLLSFLCTANNHIPRITSMVKCLGEHGSGGWPTVEECRSLDESALRGMGFGYRAATIPKVVEIVHANGGEGFLDSLSNAGYEESHREVLGWPGVGPKLADCICLYALGHDEAVPVDTHLWAAVTQVMFPEWQGTNLTVQKHRFVGDHFRALFGKDAGLAQLILYHDHLRRQR